MAAPEEQRVDAVGEYAPSAEDDLTAANQFGLAADAVIICLRGTRSLRTPPKSVVDTSARANAATTKPSCTAEPPRTSTAKARATGVIALYE
jgi:hypothetical protein